MEKTLHQKSKIVNTLIKLISQTTLILLLSCFAVFALAQQCDPDIEAPEIVCIAGLNVDFQDGNPIQIVWGLDFDGGTTDNCTEFGNLDFRIQKASVFDGSVPASQSITVFSGPDMITVVIWVGDESGNWSNCSTTLNVVCDAEQVAPVAVCDGVPVINATGTTTEVTVDDINVGSYDNCGEITLGLAHLEDYDPENPPTNQSLTLSNDASEYVVALSVKDAYGNEKACFTTVQINWNDCEGDETAPAPYCFVGLEFSLQAPQTAVQIWATDFDAASFDNCTTHENLQFRLELAENSSGTPPETESLFFTEADAGFISINLWVGDENGNWDYCNTYFNLNAGCANDMIPPVAICEDQITWTINDGDEFLVSAIDIDQGSFDNCSEVFLTIGTIQDFDSGVPLTNEEVLLTNDFAQYQLVLVVEDVAGNQNFCMTTVNLDWNCTEDNIAPDLGCPGSINYYNGENLPNQKLWAEDLAQNAVDNCTLTDNLIFRIEFISDFNENEPPAAEYLSLNELPSGVYTVVTWVGDESGNWNYCNSIFYYSTSPTIIHVSGYVFSDTLMDCTMDPLEEGIGQRTVYLRNQGSGTVKMVVTDENGYYEMADTSINPSQSLFELGVLNTPNTNIGCDMTVTFDQPIGSESSYDKNFAFQFEQEDPNCPVLSVDMGASSLRHCLENDYTVFYCNNSLAVIADVYVEIELDPFLTMTGSPIPFSNLGDNVYRFDLGTIYPLDCGSFNLEVFVSCEASFGQTHCSEAHIFPDTPCDEPDDAWSGAIIEVSGSCDEQGVHLRIENVGAVDMPVPRNYIVVEDVVMYSTDVFQLDAGMDMLIDFPANGATWRLEADQEPGFQGYSMNAVAVEGCGGINMTGLVNIFTFNDENSFASVDCLENVNSFDPNDKQAFPTGYGDAHFIEANTEIEYQVRFQNTGTAPAFKVVLLDTLSQYLDPATLQTGASSHPYRAELLEGNVLKFTFDDINLPDSTSNEAASHGFVKFKINQIPGNPNGTVILNDAGIYFDTNPVVMTNEVIHTIGDHFITVNNEEYFVPDARISVFPNPFNDQSTISIYDYNMKEGAFSLYNLQGQRVLKMDFEGSQFQLKTKTIHPGMYFYKLYADGILIGTGKMVKE